MQTPALSHRIVFILLSSIGGWLLSLTTLSIGWMIGTLSMAALLSFLRPAFLQFPNQSNGLPKFWLNVGQCLLGIQLGHKINLTTISIFKENWAVIFIMLVISILFSLLSGYALWKFSRLDILSSFFASAPGGLSSIPGIAEEAGANTGVVSIIQTMRVLLVVFTIPLAISPVMVHSAAPLKEHYTSAPPPFEVQPLLWTAVIIVVAILGAYIGKKLRSPAPWLIGSMLSVAVVQSLISSYIGSDQVAWWPHSLIILSQVLIAASVGSRLHKNMFTKLRGTIMIGMASTICLILAMLAAAFLVSMVTDISFITAVLAFAPGGIAEMATTAVVLHADAAFVLSVQVLRVVAVNSLLPLLFKLLGDIKMKKQTGNRAQA